MRFNWLRFQCLCNITFAVIVVLFSQCVTNDAIDGGRERSKQRLIVVVNGAAQIGIGARERRR